jgi:hypothetical protein
MFKEEICFSEQEHKGRGLETERMSVVLRVFLQGAKKKEVASTLLSTKMREGTQMGMQCPKRQGN